MDDYKSYFECFEAMRKENRNYVTIVFFKTFSKIVLLPKKLNQYLSWNIKFEEDSFTYQGTAYSSHKKYPFKEETDSPTKELDVRFSIHINYSDIIGLVSYESETLKHSTIVTAKDFGRASDRIQEEIETICERILK